MKKVLSLVLAVLMVLSLSVVAFANDVEATGTEAEVGSNVEGGKIDLNIKDFGSEAAVAQPDKPGATYYFTLMESANDPFDTLSDKEDPVAETGMNSAQEKDYIKHLKLSIKESGDAMIEDYAIVVHNDVYKVKVTTKAFYTVDTHKATWTITAKRNTLTVLKATYKPVQAWEDLGDVHYNDNVAGETYITVVGNCAPECNCDPDDCATDTHAVDRNGKDMYLGISYDKGYTDDHNLGVVVTLKAADTYFEIQVGATPVWFSGTNKFADKGVMIFKTGVDKDLWIKNPEAEVIEKVAFTGDLDFDYKAVQHIDAGEDMFVYAIVDGKYDLGKFEWNEDAECWETTTFAPIDVLISDVELKGLNAASAGKENPGTGSVDFVNVAVALGVVSLAAAGAVALKK